MKKCKPCKLCFANLPVAGDNADMGGVNMTLSFY